MKTPFRLPLLALGCLCASVTIARAQTPGTLDPTFLAQTDATVRAIALQMDGKILIGGDFTMVNDTPRQHIARLNTDGSLDTDFDPGADGPVYAFAIQPADSLIVVGGDFNLVGNASAGGNIGRLNTDGTPDMTFVMGGAYTDGPVYALAVLRDGDIAVGGDYFILNGQGHGSIGYLHNDGTIDADVVPPDPNGPVYAIALNALGDGVVFGGNFTYLEDDTTLTYNNIAALDNKGALDTTFNPGTGANNTVYTLLNFVTGYLAGGLFTNYDGTTTGGLTFIDSDGSGAGEDSILPFSNGIIDTVAILSGGSSGVAVGGTFTSFANAEGFGSGTYNHVTQLGGSGELVVPNFDPGSGTDGTVYSVVYQTDGMLLVGGDFTTFNGAPHVGIARVYAGTAVDVSVNLSTISRGAGQKAKVTFTLVGGTSDTPDTVVNYKLRGPLVNGTDYKELSGSVTIPSGATKVSLKIKPIAGGADGKLKLTVLPSPENYNAGSSPTVKIKITD